MNRRLLGPFCYGRGVAAFEILEHPADIGFRAFGATVAHLFENSALALLSTASEPASVAPLSEYLMEASGTDYESLLVAWLSEVLYWFDGRRIGFRHFQITEISPGRVRGIGFGEPWDAARHQARLIVKAVTWHQLRVAQVEGGWIAEVYLDV